MHADWMQAVLSQCDASMLRTPELVCLQQHAAWVLREDHYFTGNPLFKWRKYASLIPHLVSSHTQRAGLIGSANSSNVACLAPLLPPLGISCHVFLKRNKGMRGYWQEQIEACCEPDHIHWIEGADWPRVNEIAEEWKLQMGEATEVIPEGCACDWACAGASTLAIDIVNLKRQPFSHIWIDAGTAHTAACLALGLGAAEYKTKLHVLLVAGDEAGFHRRVVAVRKGLPVFAQVHLPEIELHFPHTARSFGSVNREVLNFVNQFEKEEGMQTNPVYSGKLFMNALRWMRETKPSGECLFIHSGGLPARVAQAYAE